MSVFIQYVWYGSDCEQHRGSLNVFSLENRVVKVCHTLYKKNPRSYHHHHDNVLLLLLLMMMMTTLH
jgi:hypothetical protein